MHYASRIFLMGMLMCSMALSSSAQDDVFIKNKKPSPEVEGMNTPSESERYSWPIISIGGGAVFYTGGLKSPRNLSKFSGTRWGVNAQVEQRFGKYMGGKANIFYGMTAGDRHTFTQFNNFQSRLISADLRFCFHFDHLIGKKQLVAPYIAAGIGYVNYRTKSDLKDSQGVAYNLWDDGSLRDQAQTGQTNGNPKELRRDFTYETMMNKSGNSITFPVEAGLRFKMHNFFDFGIGYTQTFMLNRFLSVKNTRVDSYGYASATLYWYLGQLN